MKKIFSLILIILTLFIPKTANANVFYDDTSVNTAVQAESLNELSQKYSTPVYVAVTSEFFGDITSCADRFYAEHNLEKNGILLYIDPIKREYSIYVHNNAQKLFNGDALDYIEDSILPPLKNSDYSKAIYEFEDAVETVLELYQSGENYRNPFNASLTLIICLIIGFIIGLISVLIMKGKMKSVFFRDSAREYTVNGSFKLSNSRDIFLYRTVIRTKRETESKSRSSSSGGSFSSRSGKF